MHWVWYHGILRFLPDLLGHRNGFQMRSYSTPCNPWPTPTQGCSYEKSLQATCVSFSLSKSHHFSREIWNKILSPVFHLRLMWVYQASCLKNGKCSTQKENTRNMCSKHDFTHYSGTDTQDSQEFIPNFVIINT